MGLQVAIISALFGLAFGSFINAAVYRLYKKETMQTRSHCVHCRYVLQWYDLIPLGSFLLLKGKCRSCSKPIPKNYFFVEFITSLLFAVAGYLWVLSGLSIEFLLRDLLLILVLVFLFVYDAKYYLLPDIVTLPAIIFFFLIQWYLGESLQNLLLAMMIGGGFFFLQFAISKGKWIGGGDIRLGTLMGVVLGWPLILVGLFLAYIIGALFAVPLLLTKKKELGSQIPFGTFLTLATVISMWWGQSILDWYLAFL